MPGCERQRQRSVIRTDLIEQHQHFNLSNFRSGTSGIYSDGPTPLCGCTLTGGEAGPAQPPQRKIPTKSLLSHILLDPAAGLQGPPGEGGEKGGRRGGTRHTHGEVGSPAYLHATPPVPVAARRTIPAGPCTHACAVCCVLWNVCRCGVPLGRPRAPLEGAPLHTRAGRHFVVSTRDSQGATVYRGAPSPGCVLRATCWPACTPGPGVTCWRAEAHEEAHVDWLCACGMAGAQQQLFRLMVAVVRLMDVLVSSTPARWHWSHPLQRRGSWKRLTAALQRPSRTGPRGEASGSV